VFRDTLGYMSVNSPKKSQLKQTPPLETTGLWIARLGTVAWSAVALVSWIVQPEGALKELPETATAGVLLGFLGQWFLGRRARRLNLTSRH
jgi:hypothetical protein